MPTLNRRYKSKQGSNNRAFYQSHRWHSFSMGYRKNNPLCVECKKNGKIQKSECVDHITPIEKGGDMYNLHNLQALCNSCHSKKTAKEK